MKKIFYKTNYFIVASLVLIFSSCNPEGNYKGKAVGKTANFDSIVNSAKAKPLADIYYKHGNFINSKEFPPIVNATQVNKHINDWLLIDIRNYKDYEEGHIRGAYNVHKYRLIDYLTEVRNADAYEKVVLIDYAGQLSSYVTSILRFAGFDNVYTMYYGMSTWNSKFSEPLKKGYQKGFSDYIIETVPKKEDTKNHGGEIHHEDHKSIDELIKHVPQLSDSLPSEVIELRARKLLKVEPKNYLVNAETFFNEYKQHPNKYLPVFYMDNKKKFEESHIKGAELFRSRKDLSLDTKLAKLPTDKDIVLYCKTGHTSASAAAYLNMLGYKSYSLNFGYNSYNGDSKQVEDFINDFPVVAGKDPFGSKSKKKK
jgi:rhodanese-related sulfurtransferase